MRTCFCCSPGAAVFFILTDDFIMTLPMLIQQKIGNIQSFKLNGRSVDILPLAWFETNKRMLHKSTAAGISITLKFLKEDPAFSQGDIVFEDNYLLIVIEILPADSITIRPESMYRMASLCYEIGNKHLPLFIDGDDMLVPYDEPLFRWLTASRFKPVREARKLLNPLKTTTMAHSHIAGGGSLFSKIMQLTKNTGDD